jgi:MOSC domain-containing protein YiiM
MRGEVVSVNLSEETGTRKCPVDGGVLRVGHGLEGDAHAGEWHRQVSLLDEASIQSMEGRGLELGPGDFAENLTTRGLDLVRLPIGTVLKVGGTVELEITQIGKECHQGCDIRAQLGDCVMPREGVFARVLRGGPVRSGDPIEVVPLGVVP